MLESAIGDGIRKRFNKRSKRRLVETKYKSTCRKCSLKIASAINKRVKVNGFLNDEIINDLISLIMSIKIALKYNKIVGNEAT